MLLLALIFGMGDQNRFGDWDVLELKLHSPYILIGIALGCVLTLCLQSLRRKFK